MTDRRRLTDPSELNEHAVIDALRRIREASGDPSTCEALLAFTKQREAQANREDSDRGNIEAAIQMARIYANAGYLEEALGEFETTREAAAHGGHDDLLQRIDEFMDKIEARLAEDEVDPTGEVE